MAPSSCQTHRYSPVQPQQEAIVLLPLLHCGKCYIFWIAEFGVSGSILGQLQALRRRLSQLDPTRVHPAAAPLRPSAVFAPDHPPLVPKWFMFCGSCFCALGQSFPRPLPWKSLTTVSPGCVVYLRPCSLVPSPRWCFSCCFGRRSFDRRLDCA